MKRHRAAAMVLAASTLLITPVAQAQVSLPHGSSEMVNSEMLTPLKMSPVGRAATDAALYSNPDMPIIVLGARLDENCQPYDVLKDRVATARVIALMHPQNPVIVTGGVTQPGCKSEAQAMKEMLVNSGVNNRIIMDEAADSTYGNAQNTAHYARLIGGTSQNAAVLVTSPNHMPRAIDTYAKNNNSAVWLAAVSTVN